MRRVAIAAWIAVGAVAPAHAYLLCTEPSKPYCIKWAEGFSSSSDFEDCRWEMQRYLKDAQAYVDCLQQESDETVRESNAAIKTFNCLAQGESYCP